MKATGIVRRIDDLGRIVIPKEIRRTLHIRESDPLLTTLIESVNADKHSVCRTFSIEEKKRVSDLQRNRFALSVIDFVERVGNKPMNTINQ